MHRPTDEYGTSVPASLADLIPQPEPAYGIRWKEGNGEERSDGFYGPEELTELAKECVKGLVSGRDAEFSVYRTVDYRSISRYLRRTRDLLMAVADLLSRKEVHDAVLDATGNSTECGLNGVEILEANAELQRCRVAAADLYQTLEDLTREAKGHLDARNNELAKLMQEGI